MAIPIMALMAAAQAAIGIGQKIDAGIKRRKAEKNFTPYQIPSSINLMLDKANSLASQTEIPGADIYRSRAQSNAAQTIESAQRTAGSSSDVMGALPGVQANLNSFYQDIAAKGANYYQQNQAQQQQALNTFGQYETERWRQNEYMPYMQALGDAQAAGQAGNQNIGSAIGAGMSIGMAKWEQDAMKKEMELFKLQHGLGGQAYNVPANRMNDASMAPMIPMSRAQVSLNALPSNYGRVNEGGWVNNGNQSTFKPYY